MKNIINSVYSGIKSIVFCSKNNNQSDSALSIRCSWGAERRLHNTFVGTWEHTNIIPSHLPTLSITISIFIILSLYSTVHIQD